MGTVSSQLIPSLLSSLVNISLNNLIRMWGYLRAAFLARTNNTIGMQLYYSWASWLVIFHF